MGVDCNFKFQGSNDKRLYTKIIKDYFVFKKNLVYEIDSSSDLHIICNTVQNIYNKYGVDSLGNEGHNIIEDYFINDFDLSYNIFPFAKELPVWKFNFQNTITGHIDIPTFYYKNCQLYFLLLDFKPKGDSEILKSIPQLTIYGYLFHELLKEGFKALSLELFDGCFNIACIGFNNEVAYLFNPFSVYDHILDFLDYEAEISKRTQSISFDKDSLTKLVAFLDFS